MIVNDFLCKCNHEYSEHIIVLDYFKEEYTYCNECAGKVNKLPYHDFVPDNLGYIEQRYEQQAYERNLQLPL